jgi:hypothetical protein
MKIKLYSHNFHTVNKEKNFFSFQFSFDDFFTDSCIVYDVNNPLKWACDNSYKINGRCYNAINKLSNKIIKTNGKLKMKEWY